MSLKDKDDDMRKTGYEDILDSNYDNIPHGQGEGCAEIRI